MKGYNQVCVWPGTIVGEDETAKFEAFMLEQFGCKVKFLETVVTLPDRDSEGYAVPGTGGRHDVFFAVADEDVMKFAVPRLTFGIRWWEDVLGNGNGGIYPAEILERYPATW